MNFIPTNIEGVVILEPRVFSDDRGYFFESYSKRQFDEYIGYTVDFVQDNQSRSVKGVIRGMHFQRPPYAQAKLVRCISGCVLDVAVDLRAGSATYGKHIAVELSSDNHRMLFIPKGFAHGFSVLSEEAIFEYKCDQYYHPEAEGGLSLLDPALGIDWKTDLSKAILSAKDGKHPKLNEFKTPF